MSLKNQVKFLIPQINYGHKMKKYILLVAALSLFGCSAIHQQNLAAQGITKETESADIESARKLAEMSKDHLWNEMYSKLHDANVNDEFHTIGPTQYWDSYWGKRVYTLDNNILSQKDGIEKIFTGPLTILQSLDNYHSLVRSVGADVFMLQNLGQSYPRGVEIEGMFVLDRTGLYSYESTSGAALSVYKLTYVPGYEQMSVLIDKYKAEQDKVNQLEATFKRDFGVDYDTYKSQAN